MTRLTPIHHMKLRKLRKQLSTALSLDDLILIWNEADPGLVAMPIPDFDEFKTEIELLLNCRDANYQGPDVMLRPNWVMKAVEVTEEDDGKREPDPIPNNWQPLNTAHEHEARVGPDGIILSSEEREVIR